MKFVFIIFIYLFIGLIDFEIINNFFNAYALSENDIQNNENDEIDKSNSKKKLYFFIFISSVLFLGLIYLYFKTSSISDVADITSTTKNVPTDENKEEAMKILQKLLNETISGETLEEINESIKNNQDDIQEKIKELLNNLKNQ